MAKRKRYPGLAEAERQRSAWRQNYKLENQEPDFIGDAPNYDQFEGCPPERVLVWLNID